MWSWSAGWRQRQTAASCRWCRRDRPPASLALLSIPERGSGITHVGTRDLAAVLRPRPGPRYDEPRRERHLDELAGTDRARAVLPACQRRGRGSGRRGPAPPRGLPWRADRHQLPVLQRRLPVLDQPRLRHPRRQLRRQHRFGRSYRERLDRSVGCGRRRRLRHRSAGDGGAGSRRPETAGDPRRQRGRLHDAARADGVRHLRGRRQPLRHRRPRDPGAGDSQVRVPLPRHDHRASRSRPSSTSSAHRSITSTG